MATKILTDLDFGGVSRITNLAAPQNDNDAVRKADLDSVAEGISWKDAVRVATQANINLSSPGDTIDGITMESGDRVLVKAQDAAKENGIYVWNGASTAMSRAIDADTTDKLEQAIVTVEEGTDQGNSYRQTQVNFTLDQDDVLWTLFGASAPNASETTRGIAEIATQSEVDDGADDERIVTPKKLAASIYSVKRASTTIGDGSATKYTVTHNLGTRHVFVKVFRTDSPYDEIICDVEFKDENNVDITFSSAPSNNEYTVSIIG